MSFSVYRRLQGHNNVTQTPLPRNYVYLCKYIYCVAFVTLMIDGMLVLEYSNNCTPF